MSSFWIWLGLLMLAWGGSYLDMYGGKPPEPLYLIATALFFAVFFIVPLLRRKPLPLTIALISASLLAAWAHLPPAETAAIDGPSLSPLLLQAVVAGLGVLRLPTAGAAAVAATAALAAFAPAIWSGPAEFPYYIPLFILLAAAALLHHRMLAAKHEEIRSLYDALLSEHRSLKRRVRSDEEVIRREERTQIGREIHDSVGHKLTALLLQLEVFRMQSGEELEGRVLELKQLAAESLEETRGAVRALGQRESGGLPAVLALIRRLETESFIRISFSASHGALTAPLNSAQSVAVYRAVQEGLTNMMKHGRGRQADLSFEAPGGGVFRFELANACKGDECTVAEGYGLRGMRSRLEQCGGRLDATIEDGRFILSGSIRLNRLGGTEPL